MPAFLFSRSFLLIALIVAALLAGLSGYALTSAGDDSGLKLTLPTAGPTPTLAKPTTTPSATPTPTATASATPTATPTATASASATPTATATSTASPTPKPSATGTKTYAYPKPTKSYAPLQLTVRSDRGTGQVGDTFSITAVATDGDGEIYMNGLDFGDGTKVGAQPSPRHCKSYPPLHSPPGAYKPEPDNKNYGKYTHKYLAPGTYTITFRVASVNADCKPNGPKSESQVLSLKVTVTAPPA